QRQNTRLPVEDGRFAPLLAAALDREFLRLQSFGGNDPAAFDLALTADEKRSDALRLADRHDPVFIRRVLEPIRRFSDQEAVRAEKRLVDEIDAPRERFLRWLGRRFGGKGGWL